MAQEEHQLRRLPNRPTPAAPVEAEVRGSKEGAAAAYAAPSGETRLVLRNLGALGGLGVVISFWVLTCTDWFPVVGGLLGLGGAFAWLAFVSGLLTDDRKKMLQLEIERALLLRPNLWKGVAATGLLFGVAILPFGTLELRSLSAEEHRVLQIRGRSNAAADKRDAWVLPPFGKARKLVLASWMAGGVRVRVQGLPAQTFRVGPLVPTRLTVPGSFEQRTVALFRADSSITENVRETERRYYFAVSLDGHVIGVLPDPFRGHTIWAGCHADVKLPGSLTDKWRRETPNFPPIWLTPLALAEDVSLDDAKRIDGWLLRNVKGLKLGDPVSTSHFHKGNVIYSAGREIVGRHDRVLEILLTP